MSGLNELVYVWSHYLIRVWYSIPRVLPVFVKPGLECVDSGCSDNMTGETIPLINYSNGECIATDTRLGTRFNQFVFVSPCPRVGVSLEEAFRIEIDVAMKYLENADHVPPSPSVV